MDKTVSVVTKLAAIGAVALGLSACSTEKSRNVLSPNVAGPIAGVAITPPLPISPLNGNEVTNNEPLRLVFDNSVTNGERPVWYIVELAADPGFTSKLFANNRVTPSSGTRTTVVVEGTLATERTYFWRVKADDGANSSEFSQTIHFDFVIPVVIDPPVPVSPVGGQTTTSTAPQLIVSNGRVAGRVGKVDYWFEIARDQAFANIIETWGAERSSGGSTMLQSPHLPAGTQFFWRAIGTNGKLYSAFSNVQSFRTPAAAPPGGGGGGGGGGWTPPPPPAGGRTADPPPGGKLPLPNMSGLVEQVAAQFPNALRNSCQNAGGTWEFMDRLVNELRKHDTRWGYNWKRGNVGDPSLDVVDYHWGRGPDENSTEVYIIDVIGGHCGPSPSASWVDNTDITIQSGTIGRWTGRGRF
jgi:hypothetical protein